MKTKNQSSFSSKYLLIAIVVVSVILLGIERFILHRFADFRKEGYQVQEAMKLAVVKAFSSVLSSGLTTVVGFADRKSVV